MSLSVSKWEILFLFTSSKKKKKKKKKKIEVGEQEGNGTVNRCRRSWRVSNGLRLRQGKLGEAGAKELRWTPPLQLIREDQGCETPE